MSSRRAAVLALLTLSAIAVVVGCQDYNFNPVGACLIQPGSLQVKLADVSTADVLFVVDDSGSMESKQQKLAQNFTSFIQALAVKQAERAAKGLEPFDFHIAVTTSSVFQDWMGTMTTSYPSSFSCVNDATCTQAGAPCSGGLCAYNGSSQLQCCLCTPGVATAGAAYPQGDFVAYGSNPKVLHFTKDLGWSTCTTTGTFTCTDTRITTLIQQFSGVPGGASYYGGTSYYGGNVEVGGCGSGEEQHLQGGRLAMQKVLSGKQPGLAAGEFPHLGAKLVVVWVGDEDDCSSDPSNPVVLSGNPGNDSCVADKNLPLDQQKEYRISDFAAYFQGLVAPAGQSPTAAQPYVSLAAAFIVSSNRCTDGSYAPADCCYVQSPASCTGSAAYACQVAYAAGVRFLQLADLLAARNDDLIEGSVCEDFGPILAGSSTRPGIADLVVSPPLLHLPSTPASSQIAILRIVDASGNQVKVCTQATGAADQATAGWWFQDCSDSSPTPAVAAAPTTCVYLNHASGTCEANPGQTYSMEYVGVLPAGGCPSPSTDPTVPHSSSACAAALGGKAGDWWCYGPTTAATGTCVCNQNPG